MMNRETVRRSVTLRQREFDLVQWYAQEMGLDFSSALRVMVNEWAAMRAERARALQAIRSEDEPLVSA